LACSRAPERLPKKGFALFERSEFAKPRQHRGAQGIPPLAGQGTQGAFSSPLRCWFVFFGQAKKMNRRTKVFLLLLRLLGNQK
jgi:hypothetical protein